jgi:acyl-CoA reductase-like NAD-dependent aldehyde dehydrogenase
VWSEHSALITEAADHDSGTTSEHETNAIALTTARAGAAQRAIEAARTAQRQWAATTVKQRIAVAKRWRHLLAKQAEAVAHTVDHLAHRHLAETLAAEVLPLADACRFLEQNASRLLAPQRYSARGRPQWLRGIHLEVLREPYGVILVIGPRNYPLLLPGVHALQALVAGNAALVKPGVGGAAAALAMRTLWIAAGLDPRLFTVLEDSAETARSACRGGIDKVVLTGSQATGTAVLRELASEVIPAVCELSGCDAVFVQQNADLDLLVAALRFGLRFNGSKTCIAPRRVFVPRPLLKEVERRLCLQAADFIYRPLSPHLTTLVTQALADGARVVVGQVQPNAATAPLVLSEATPTMSLLRTDITAPVLALVPVRDDEEALAAASQCPYALGAAVFGHAPSARALAQRVHAGVVVVNDVIVPTADPRLPFAGRKRSGFGVTRGAEGLLELTAIKAITVRAGHWYPHYDPPHPADVELFRAYIASSHGATWPVRLRGLLGMVSAMAKHLLQRSQTQQRARQ